MRKLLLFDLTFTHPSALDSACLLPLYSMVERFARRLARDVQFYPALALFVPLKGSMLVTPPPDSTREPLHADPFERPHPSPDDSHPGISWFLHRELVSVPLALVLVGTLLLFGISPATLLFVALMTVLVLGWVWSGRG